MKRSPTAGRQLSFQAKLENWAEGMDYLENVYRELQALRERVEDLEDLRDLGEAIAENAGKPLIPWEEVKKDLDLLTPCDFAPRASLIARARSEQNTVALKPDLVLPKQSLPWLTILLDWSIACSATDKTTSNRASINTNLNSSYSASNGSKKKPNHSTFNSFPLSNFHHQFLERDESSGPLT